MKELMIGLLIFCLFGALCLGPGIYLIESSKQAIMARDAYYAEATQQAVQVEGAVDMTAPVENYGLKKMEEVASNGFDANVKIAESGNTAIVQVIQATAARDVAGNVMWMVFAICGVIVVALIAYMKAKGS